MEEITEALSNSAGTTNPPEEIIQDENQLKMEIPLTEEEQKIKLAREEYEKSQEDHAKKVVEGIHAGYMEAKGLAQDLSAKTAGTWIEERELVKMLRQEPKAVKRLLAHLDRFGMLECKIVGPAVMVKTNRHPEHALQKLLKDKGQLMEKIAQLDALLAIVHSECPKPEAAKEAGEVMTES